MAAIYLPLLLAANAATPDDSSVTTLPTSQVDYLSHEWREEDVWSSWRSMTRQKKAIANGTRLENASWRTWWKQRNKLRTISPKTLNWLKDSDVTWLYGPLHPGVDWYPLAKSASGSDEPPCSPSYCSPSVGYPYTKPILKHRSIGEILCLPPAPFLDVDSDVEVAVSKDPDLTLPPESSNKPHSTRPPLLHTKSDTHLARHVMPDLFRKDSPPRIFSRPCAGSSSPPDEGPSNETSTGSEQDLAPIGSQPGKKKHISFNTFVEQCIAIEKPKLKRPNNSSKPRFSVVEFDDDDGYDEDSEMGYDDSEQLSAPTPTTFYSTYGVDSDSDSDDILEMRTSSSRSRSSSSSRSANGIPYYQTSRRLSSEQHQPPMEKEHRTIAYIAPTILKTTGVGNDVPIFGYDEPGQALTGVELVYVPPIKGSPNGPRYGSISGASSRGNVEIYPHKPDDYFGSHSSGSQSSSSSGTSPQIPNVGFISKPSSSSSTDSIAQKQLSWGDDFSESIIHSEPIGIPLEIEEADVVGEDDAFDYFVGPDLGEDFSKKLPRQRIANKGFVEEQRAEEVLKFAEGGAESVIGGRSSEPDGRDVSKPIPVLIPKSRIEQISPPQPICIPSPSLTVDVSRSAPHEQSPRTTSQLLCPPDAPAPRGRTSPTLAPSVSGSTTSPSTSLSRSSDSRSESRGRSSTRNSSYSDRERSGSRSSRSTNSPLGSVSPSGSAIGIGSQYSSRDIRSGGTVGRERGRERTGRKISGSVSSSPSSLSPPNPASPTRSANGDYQPYHPTQSEHYSSLSGSMADSISSSGSNSSTIGPNSQGSSGSTATGAESAEERIHFNPRGSMSRNQKCPPLPIPSPIPEEDEQRSRHPTPVNSPIMAMRPILPIAPPHMSSPGITICTLPPSPEKSLVSPTQPRDYFDGTGEPQAGTLVGRAVEIVTSARGLLGSFWHTGMV